MPGGRSWRLCLCAFLLFTGRADASSDLNDGGPIRVSRTGSFGDTENDSNESQEENIEDSPISYKITSGEESAEYRKNMFYNQDQVEPYIIGSSLQHPGYRNPGPKKNYDYHPALNSFGSITSPGQENPWFGDPQGHFFGLPVDSGLQAYDLKQDSPIHHVYLNGHGGIYPNGKIIQSEIIDDPAVHNTPKNPSHIIQNLDNRFPVIIENTNIGVAHLGKNKIISRLIPVEERVPLNEIPGADDVIVCSNEGELHNLWLENYCMVCVCLSKTGMLRPICVSCQSCSAPLIPSSTPEPSSSELTSPAPETTPTPVEVSCKPLPVNELFQSPLDPCKVCVCTETYTQQGDKDVKINCHHNPQCVVPPYSTTPSIQTSTPIPLPVCDKFPQNVPFPHPQELCKICECTTRWTQFGPEQEIRCYPNPECQSDAVPPELEPSTETPAPVTDLPKPEICNQYAENVPFRHPLDHCQVCKCVSQFNIFGNKKKITCFVEPDCTAVTHKPWHPTTEAPWPITIYPDTTPAPHDIHCAPLPIGTPYQNPLNPCQVCVCTERVDPLGQTDVQINCEANSDCVLPDIVTTLPPEVVTPVPLPACKEFPENVLFPHPTNECQVCKCIVKIDPTGFPVEYISCDTKPECLQKPTTDVVTTTETGTTRTPSPAPTPSPQPDNVHCAPLPSGKPFQNPLNPCQVCVCAERVNPLGQTDVQIDCEVNPECVLPDHMTPLPPEVNTSIPLPACNKFPVNVLFPHPTNECQVCKCVAKVNPLGVRDQYITCYVRPECHPTPEPEPTPAPTPETDYFCAQKPLNVFFSHPLDPCMLCKCYKNHYQQNVQIVCFEKPECSQTPVPENTTPSVTSQPDNVSCAPLPVAIPFPNPLEPCQTCVCTESVNPLTGQRDVSIDCQDNAQCVLPSNATTLPPDISGLIKLPACKEFPNNVYFPHPSDACKLCKCTVQTSQYGPEEAISCIVRPECASAASTQKPHDLISTTPTSESQTVPVSCKPLPTGTQFQNPLNPCQICVCSETVDQFGRPDVKIGCQENPACVLPDTVTTLPPTPDIIPISLPACAKFPTNVEFPHPQNACRVCKCTIALTPWGVPEEQISCYTKPDCESEPPGPTTAGPLVSITTELPEPSVCEGRPPNVPFPLPQDPCKLCKCTNVPTPIGDVMQLSCYTNSACSATPTTTLVPSTPKGPLPGPYPHESCSPYKPNKPFQHPWDDCQVCICREAISSDHISIEVNCYTKPSCCIEPPFDAPGIQGSSQSDVLIGQRPGMSINGQTGGNMIGQISGSVNRPWNANLTPTGGQWYLPHGQKIIDQTGGTIIGQTAENLIIPSSGNVIVQSSENKLQVSNGNLFRPAGVQWFGPPGDKPIGPSGGNVIGPSSGNVIRPAGATEFRFSNDNLYKPASTKWFGPPGGKIIGTSGGNVIGPSIGNIIGPSIGNIIKHKDVNKFKVANNNLYESENINWFGPPRVKIIGPSGGDVGGLSGGKIIGSNVPKGEQFRPTGEKWFGLPGVKDIKHLSTSISRPYEEDWHGHSNEISNIPFRGNLISHPGGNLIGPMNDNKISPTGGNVIRPKLSPYSRPAGNLYIPNLEMHELPIGGYDISLGHQPKQHSMISAFPTQYGSPQVNLYSGGDGDGPNYLLQPDLSQIVNSGANAFAEASAVSGGLSANANAEAKMIYHQHTKGSTKMRTKSGRPSSEKDSEDYD